MTTNTSVEQTLKDVAQKLEEEQRAFNTDVAAASAISEYTRRYKEFQEGEGAKKRKKRHHRRFRDQAETEGKESKHPVSGVNAAPQHVHGNDWREMLALTATDFMSAMSKMKPPAGAEHTDVQVRSKE
uniref:Reverse transcriptase domain-containing protein n=1 Tax=Steinernema glaseri TaxID=37863 RepID=A0A1I7ZL18_9BILA